MVNIAHFRAFFIHAKHDTVCFLFALVPDGLAVVDGGYKLSGAVYGYEVGGLTDG
jgi:hypothetical protein